MNSAQFDHAVALGKRLSGFLTFDFAANPDLIVRAYETLSKSYENLETSISEELQKSKLKELAMDIHDGIILPMNMLKEAYDKHNAGEKYDPVQTGVAAALFHISYNHIVQ